MSAITKRYSFTHLAYSILWGIGAITSILAVISLYKSLLPNHDGFRIAIAVIFILATGTHQWFIYHSIRQMESEPDRYKMDFQGWFATNGEIALRALAFVLILALAGEMAVAWDLIRKAGYTDLCGRTPVVNHVAICAETITQAKLDQRQFFFVFGSLGLFFTLVIWDLAAILFAGFSLTWLMFIASDIVATGLWALVATSVVRGAMSQGVSDALGFFVLAYALVAIVRVIGKGNCGRLVDWLRSKEHHPPVPDLKASQGVSVPARLPLHRLHLADSGSADLSGPTGRLFSELLRARRSIENSPTYEAHMRANRLYLLPALIALTLAAVSCQPTGSSTSPSALTRIVADKRIVVGYIVFPPAVTKDPNTGQLGGHFIASIREIAKEAGWTVDFVETDWSTFPAGLQSGRFDVSIAPTFITVPRAIAVGFTRPLFYAGNSAIVRLRDTRFSGLESLRVPGLRIAVTQGEAGHEYARTNLPQATLSVHPGSDQSLAFQEVITGRADVALGDAYVTSQFTAAHKGEVRDLFARSPYNLTPVAWAVRQSDLVLLTFVNSSIEALESRGQLDEFERASGAHWLHPARQWEERR